MENKMRLEISALSVNESFARSAVAAFALSLSPSLTELSDVKTAVSEGVTNCIVHAYKSCTQASVVIECRAEKGGYGGVLHIAITDSGCGIEDVEAARAPSFTTGESYERCGMGFLVMESFTDGLSVKSKLGRGTTVLMRKILKP